MSVLYRTVSCYLLAGIACVANAQLFNVAFGNGSVTPTGGAVLGGPGDYWNAFDGTGGNHGGFFGPYPLADSNDLASGANVQFYCMGAQAANSDPKQPDPDLTHYYMFDKLTDPLVVYLGGLPVDTMFTLVLYVASDDGFDWGRSLDALARGKTQAGATASGDAMSTFSEGDNVLEFNLMSSDYGTIDIIEEPSVYNWTEEVDMNGLQLQAAPEPATLAVLAVGLAAVARRRRPLAR